MLLSYQTGIITRDEAVKLLEFLWIMGAQQPLPYRHVFFSDMPHHKQRNELSGATKLRECGVLEVYCELFDFVESVKHHENVLQHVESSEIR